MLAHMTLIVEGGAIPQWTLGDRLRKARESRGLTQTELSAVIGVSRRSISKYEVGEGEPGQPQLIAWALATGVALDWLEGDVRPKGFEPLTFWSGVSPLWAIIPFLRTDDLALTA
jgi:transcriptional regulator with XRE-family HTH domain